MCRPLCTMLVADHTNIVPVIAIEEVAERILRTTTEDTMWLHTMLESIKACFGGKLFLILLRHTNEKSEESPRHLLLISYYEESAPQGSPSTAWNSATLTDSGNSSIGYGKDVDLSLSPLKCQLSQIEITSTICNPVIFYFNL
ncbi:hypothetical protein LIER_41909 [Lithospermum erythrorhizon]|uniref:Uncharacterized protein n=1 Tax=Lithospermum erythrorhizon TaxID=34254 RepID=A0AAV3RHU2_LITER